MAEHERDERVSGAYRALDREQPPPELDAAILAASRRRRPRWAVPVSVAAVVVLAVGVALRVQMGDPEGAEEIALSPQVMQAPPPAPARQEISDAAPPAEAAADRAETAGRARAGVAVGKISAAAAPQTPEQWLERIAKLRDAGKAREADDSLAELKRRYPDYRIPEAMRARVAPR